MAKSIIISKKFKKQMQIY